MTGRPLELRIGRNPSAPVTGPTVAPAVTAAPVDDAVRAAPPEADGLLRALSAMNPALSAWTQHETAIARAEALQKIAREEEGEALRGQQVSLAGGMLPQEAHPAFARGYMANEGFKAGRQDSIKMIEEWNTESSKPDFDVDRFTRDYIAKNTKGLDDQDYLKSYVGQVGEAVTRLQAEQSKKRMAEVAAAKEESKDARIGALFTDAAYDGETFWNGWRGVFKSMREQGHAPEDLNNSFVKRAIADAYEKLDVSIINRALETPNGLGPAADPQRKLELLKARDHILAALKKEAGKEFSFARAQAQDEWKAKLEAGDVDLDVSPAAGIAAYVDQTGKDPSKFITTEAEYTSALGEFRRAQDKARDARAIEINYARDPRVTAGLPEGEKFVKEKVYAPNWKDHNTADPADTMRRAQFSLREMAKNAVPDPALKQFVSVATMDISKGVTPEFQTAVDIYAAAKRASALPALQKLMSEDDIRLLSEFQAATEGGMPATEAAKFAAKMRDPQTVERVNEVLRTPGAAAKVETGLKKVTEPWLSRNDIDPLALETQYRTRVRQFVGMGMTLDGALQRATDEFDNRTVSDGNRGRYLLPADPAILSQRALYEKAVPAIIARASAERPEHAAHGFNVVVGEDGAVTLVSKANGLPVSDFSGLSLSDVRREAAREILTPADVSTVDNVTRLVKSGRMTDAASHEALRTLNDAYLKDPRSVDRGVLGRLREQAHRDYMKVGQAEFRLGNRGGIATPNEVTSKEDFEAVSVNTGGPKGPFPSTKDTTKKLIAAGDLTTALAVAIETINPSVHLDPNGKQLNIGAGYSFKDRTPDEIRRDLKSAGVPDHMVDSVMAGKTPLDEKQAVRLTKNALEKQYAKSARTVYEQSGGVWETLPENQKAALTYLAYSTGNPAQFKTVLGHLVNKDYDAAARSLTLTYKDKNGVQHDLMQKRGGVLLKAMMQSPKAFEVLINSGK